MHHIRMHPYRADKGVAFVCLPKCASSSVREAVKHSDLLAREVTLAELQADPPPTVIAFVRNPYTRLESCYCDKVLTGRVDLIGGSELGFYTGMCFQEFVYRAAADPRANHHFYPQAEALAGFDAVHRYRVENIAANWQALRESHRWLPTLPHVNQRTRTLAQRWTHDMVHTVAHVWRKDFELGYAYVLL